MRIFPDFLALARAIQNVFNVFNSPVLLDMPVLSAFSMEVQDGAELTDDAVELMSNAQRSIKDTVAADLDVAALNDKRQESYDQTLRALEAAEKVLKHYAMGSFEKAELEKMFSSVREYLELAHQDLLGKKAISAGEASVMRAHCAVLKDTLAQLVFEGKYEALEGNEKEGESVERPFAVQVAEFFRFIFDYITWAVTFAVTFGQMAISEKNYVAEFVMGQSFFIQVPTNTAEDTLINDAKTKASDTIDTLDSALETAGATVDDVAETESNISSITTKSS